MIIFEDIGIDLDYKYVLTIQEAILKDNIYKKKNNFKYYNKVLILEHSHVYTIGTLGKISNLLVSKNELNKLGIKLIRTNRGGDITYHGPGQLVVYPILDLLIINKNIISYIRTLENIIMDVLKIYGINSFLSTGETGIWVRSNIDNTDRKICAIGIRASRFFTMHGLALNINTNLQYFNYIIPCGIKNKKVTSMSEELGFHVDTNEVKGYFIKVFKEYIYI